MSQYTFIHNYKHITEYRRSFNRLAHSVFGIDFEAWYARGCWDDRYVCYSFHDGLDIVANASVTHMDYMLEGMPYKALQIGTVMTHPDARNLGLSRQLLEKILSDHEQEYDFIYLFANPDVLQFYPKFGFAPMRETSYYVRYLLGKTGRNAARKLNIDEAAEWELIVQKAAARIPVSRRCGVVHAESILLWYCMNIFSDHIYYIDDCDAVVIAERREQDLHVYDVVAERKLSLDEWLHHLADHFAAEGEYRVIFHFTPDFDDIRPLSYEWDQPDTLFVKTDHVSLPAGIRFPMTAQA
ncbi:GNAT family N-acetyltransferase [Paenibacillus sp. OSY-SE]|uniref:GNAT family N-acetyltransferase n=1 Tax=Paenibacillus sp. OSY-SE TaxID=1196323 RepID=UPI0002E0C236|nr:GNAT family N-acetyltransferase [Paenibacillus sp. OSY-SE]